MRALILVAVAALAVSACNKTETTENNMNVDDAMTNEVVANDTTAVDANAGADANMAADANMTMNGDMNATMNASTNNAM